MHQEFFLSLCFGIIIIESELEAFFLKLCYGALFSWTRDCRMRKFADLGMIFNFSATRNWIGRRTKLDVGSGAAPFVKSSSPCSQGFGLLLVCL